MMHVANGQPSAMSAYESARRDAVVVVRDDRVQLRAHGRDPVRMIQGLVTNDMEGASAGRAVYAAMLSPKGRMIADMRIVRHDDGSLLLDLDRGALDATLAHVKKYVPPMFARFEPVQPPLSVVGVYGPSAPRVLHAATGLSVDADAAEYLVARSDELLAMTTREAGVFGVDLFVASERAHALRDALLAHGATPGDLDALDLLRIEAGRPRWGAELDAERIPLEADLLERAISTTKGCYTGQEVIVRILHRGHVNWHLRGLLLGESDPPPAGSELTAPAGDKVVARVTSAARSPALGQTVALAYVRREIEPGATLRLPDGGSALVAELPFRTSVHA